MNILLRLTFLTFTLGLGLTSQLQSARYRYDYFSHEYKKNGTSVKIREIPSKEAKNKLGWPFKYRKSSSAIIPCEVKITNHSSRGIHFSKGDLNLKLVSQKELKRYTESKTWGNGLLPYSWARFVTFLGGLELGALLAFPFAVLYSTYLFVPIVLGVAVANLIYVDFHLRRSEKSFHGKMLYPYIQFDENYIAPDEMLTQVVYVKRKDLSALQG